MALPWRAFQALLMIVGLLVVGIEHVSSGLYLHYLTGIPPGEAYGWPLGSRSPSYDDSRAKDYVVIVSLCGDSTYLEEWVSHHKR
mmetsp:Transcript_14197/g.27032  ORF Transcript_14197/g.27032 Transcript_14197/m.27032 type:complete len:85 (-) Transcript_14197:82-336(-)